MTQIKKSFVQLQQLDTLYIGDADWLANVTDQGVAKDYTFTQDADGECIEADFANEELQFAPDTVKVYSFMGGPGAAESFYGKDVVVYAGAGAYWVLYTDELFDV